MASDSLYPDICPITWRPFFMVITHPTLGDVPTYGGPYDSYTIPMPCDNELDECRARKRKRHEVTLYCQRYDHDEGHWYADEYEDVGLRIAYDETLLDLPDESDDDKGGDK